MANSLSDYTNLITSQYRNSTKFNAWVECLLTPFIDCQNLFSNLYTYFDLDTAIGNQLDMIGSIVGASRTLPFTPKYYLSEFQTTESVYNELLEYYNNATIEGTDTYTIEGETVEIPYKQDSTGRKIVDSAYLAEIETYYTDGGDVSYTVINTTDKSYMIPSGGTSVLEDEDYRFLIKAQIIRNSWHGTTQELYDKWESLFSNVYISINDPQDMTFSVIFIGIVSDIQKEMIEHDMIIPRCQGVMMTYSYTQPPIFSYDQEAGYFQGWDIGSWLEVG